MDRYREKLRVQLMINIGATVALIGVQILGYARVMRPIAGDAHWVDGWNGFITGAAFGVMALLIVGIVRLVRALGSEKRLRQMYIKENDERTREIATAARSAGTQMFLIFGLAAGVVAGYFSVAVSIAIIGCAVANSLMCAGFKLYYNRKY